ncbi:hypothetical protein P5673_026098 [Acropora cervicornis]|uniref:Uncharacterized protein n=1 Tax=Acropora cervicornis TaxID=6130 RepID=A0AAD9Q1N1_ACRCE|nr:hypothetical protein P5673_026098 [Acropora cervicornis]
MPDRDWSHKLVHKAYADARRKAAPNPVLPGDLVLIERTRKRRLWNSSFVKRYNLAEEAKESMQDVDPAEAGMVAPVSELLEEGA